MDAIVKRNVQQLVEEACGKVDKIAAELPQMNAPGRDILDHKMRQIQAITSVLKADVSNLLNPDDGSWKELAGDRKFGDESEEADSQFEIGEKRERWNFISTAGKETKAVEIFTHGNGPITEAEAETAFKSWEAEGGTNTGAHTARNVTVEVIWEVIKDR